VFVECSEWLRVYRGVYTVIRVFRVVKSVQGCLYSD